MSEGIAIVAAGPAAPEDAGPPMRGSRRAIVIPHVICVVCRTPCHRDCWSFVGGCSIFGCRGTQGLPA
ncbi:MAG: hypothetical protein WKF75_09540 [Singulisphaera sp.]